MAQHKYIIYFLFLRNCFDLIESSVNLAANKTTWQSSNYTAFGITLVSSKAVDGDNSQNFLSCTHTMEGQSKAWWQVDLGNISEIKRIKLYYRNDFKGAKERLNGYIINIANSRDDMDPQLCYQDNSSYIPTSLEPPHVCPYQGRFVKMSVERTDKTAIINLCEFEVYGCKVGLYGNGNCNTACSVGCNNSRCDPDDGTCNCTIRWKGHKCNACFDGFYGTSCTITCPKDCTGTICDRQNGSCINGCKDLKYGTHCDKACPLNCAYAMCNQYTGGCIGECNPGYHGTYCNKTCSLGCKNNICYSVNGNCEDGCNLGYNGIHCEDCATKKYGIYCNKSCPENCNQGICNRTSGFCLKGCTKKNRTGDKCEECYTGLYGSNCTSKCPPNCNNSKCTRDSGECTMDCIGKFRGPKCKECQVGYYGDSCNLSCSVGCDRNECDQKNGSCIKRCKADKYGTQCNLTCPSNCASTTCDRNSGSCFNLCASEKWEVGIYELDVTTTFQAETQDLQSSNQPASFAPTIGGAVAAILVVLVLVIVVTIVLKRRRLQTTKMTYKEEGKKQPSYSRPMKPVKIEQILDNPYVNVCEVEDQREDGLVADDTPTTSRDDVYVNAPELQTTLIPITELSTLISKKSAGNEFDKEFKKLPSGAIHPHTTGQKAENKINNRFLTTFPYDHSRIVLETKSGQSKSDYINANYIDGVENRFSYVATQGPKSNTVSDFWSMIWQVKAGKIVMLTNIIENGKRKCERYWPDNSQSKDVGHLKLTSEMEKEYAFYIARSLILYDKKTKETRAIKLFHFTMWPDHGTPDPVQLMMFHRKVTDGETALEGPCIVHCSAGIGRTGTFIALDALHEYGERTGKIDIFEYVIRMRKDRMNMIQTVDQYIVLHEALLESFQYTGRTMKKDQFFEVCNEIQDGKPKNQTHVYKEYQNLSSLRPVYGIEYYDSAREEINKRKSRNHNILAVDKYRPYLMSHHSSRTNFINAVILPSCKLRCGYLATHYPLQHTIVDLWCMIFDHDSSTVAVLDQHGDKGENLQWYPTDDKKMNVEQLTITKVSGPHTYNKVQEMEFTVKHKEREEQKSVKMFMLRPWTTGQFVPPEKTELLKLLELVDNCQKIGSGPVTVICSDGARCCGLFCAVNNVIQNLQIDDEIDIFHTVRQLQLRRPEFFTDFESYECCYDMTKCYLQLTNVYANT